VDIIVDANILIADFGLSGTAFRVAFDGIRRTASRMYVPEPAFAEAVAKHREHLAEAQDQLRKAATALRRLGRRDLAESVIGIEVGDAAATFALRLRRELLGKGVGFLPWPEVSHEVVVQRMLWGRRPTRKDLGYRDTLIWECVLAHLRVDRPAEAIFVTNNTKDFCADDGLHADLTKDLVSAGIKPGSVKVETSLEGLNKRVFEPTLALLDDTRRRLQDGLFPQFDIRVWIENHAREVVHDEHMRGVATEVPGPEVPSFSGTQIINEVKIDEVRKLSTGELLVEIAVTMTAEVAITSGAPDIKDFERRPGWEHVGSRDTRYAVVTFTAFITLVLGEVTAGKLEVLSSELTAMDGGLGGWKLY
jgi:PIN domain